MAEQNSAVGTQLKIKIGMEPLDGIHMADVDFSVRVFSDSTFKYVVIRKADAIQIDEDNYLVLVDSSKIGCGKYYANITAMIPDTDFDDGIREESVTVEITGATIEH